MASTHINIEDTLAAIAHRIIPGEFSADRTSFTLQPLTYVGARGARHTWSVRVTLFNSQKGVNRPMPITDEMLVPGATLPADSIAEIHTESCQIGGKFRDVIPTYVTVGKNLGKKNATNALTQALRNALGLYNKQMSHHQAAPADAAAQPPAAAAAAADAAAAQPPAAAAAAQPPAAAAAAAGAALQPPPQLVKSFNDAPLTPADYAAGVTVQRKLNGVRLVAYMRDGRVHRYSRTAHEYGGQDTLAGELLAAFTAWASRPARGDFGAPEFTEIYIDGELYQHGVPLNEISGQARRSAASGAAPDSLSLYVFDAFFPREIAAGRDMASRDRQRAVDAFFECARGAPGGAPHLVRVENFPVADRAALDSLVRRFLAESYEGAIARRDAAGYRYSHGNYHSSNALKLKPVFDSEFPVTGYTQGTRGKDVGALIWICTVPEAEAKTGADREFTVVPKNMSYARRYAIYKLLGENCAPPGAPPLSRFDRDIKGLPLTVEYRERSATTGKPLQARAVVFRTYEAGPAADPVAQLLASLITDQ